MEPPGEWVLLSYRLPREPSTPRTAVWRKLEQLGVARLGDGLVGLPADSRTREHLDWVAEEVTDAGGTALIWLARPAGREQERLVVATMRASRAAEYRALIEQAEAATGTPDDLARIQRRLRGELRRVERRDYFPPPEQDRARSRISSIVDDKRADRSGKP